ncbi:MAG: TIGR00730 family Rossman fold protein [Rhizobiaceae bacterium]|nr:MAG: TIGR00730 family Rossman fold protein [Rhizobiaceae bacterium]
MSTIRSICVYCGSSPGKDAAYLDAARTLGRAMGKAGMRLVYGGGAKGIMGAVAQATAEAGGSVMGIIPRFLMNKEASEAALARLDDVVVTEDMHARKHRMFEESDAFVALPGGIGTLEEIVEIMTWAQLGRHRKPMVFGNVDGFWNPMMALMEHMKREGFLHSAHLIQPLLVDDPADILPAVLGSAAGAGNREGQDSIIDRL